MLGGGIRNLDLVGDDAIRDALTGGKPWILFCDQDATKSRSKKYQEAKEAFRGAAKALAGRVQAATLECGRKLSRKSVFAFVGLGNHGSSPATVIIAANGRKPSVVPAPFLRTAQKLVGLVQRRVRTEAVDLTPGKPGSKALRRCMLSRSCVVLVHAGRAGRKALDGAMTVDDVVAAHPSVQVAILDASRAWLRGLPKAAAASMPLAVGQEAVPGVWGSPSAGQAGAATAVLVLRRDPRSLKGSGAEKGVVAVWQSGGADAVAGALAEADEAVERAKHAGGKARGKDAKTVAAAAAAAQAEAERADGGVLSALRVVRAPKPKPSAEQLEAERRERLLQEREARRRKQRATAAAAAAAGARGRSTSAGVEGDEEEEAAGRKQRVREAMDEEARQWMPEAVEFDEEEEEEAAAGGGDDGSRAYGDTFYGEDGVEDVVEEYEEDEEGFVEV